MLDHDTLLQLGGQWLTCYVLGWSGGVLFRAFKQVMEKVSS